MSRPATGRRIDVRRAQLYEGAPFTPRAIPGLTAWYRADMGITLAVNKVAAWADQQANAAYDYVQGTDARRPVYTASAPAFNGQPCLSFAGAHMLSTTGALPAFASGLSVVMAIGNTPAQSTVLLEFGTGATANAGGLYIDNPIRYRGLYHNPVSFFTQHAYTTPPTASCFITTFDPTVAAASQVRTYVDDVVGAAVSASAAPGTIVSDTWNLGARTGLVAPCTADIAEIIVINRVVSAYERALIYAYMQGRYG